MKKLIKYLTGRLSITCLFILVQLILLFILSIYFNSTFVYFYYVMLIISLLLIIAIVNDDTNPTFKIAWMIPMLILPIFGAPLYLVLGRHKVSNRIIKKLTETNLSVKRILPLDDEICDEIKAMDKSVFKQFLYIFNTAASPVYKNTQTQFLPSGENFFKSLLIELEKAERFIFLEYFIIAKGKMWDSVLGILKRKAAQGVEVRLIYDDMGTIQLLEKSYPKYLNSLGIKTGIFNPFHASLDSFLNYRDHRKITVIDGNVGFTGGINLADEYINEVKRFGHWQDSSIMIKGDAVSRLTTMFLQLWYFIDSEAEQIYEPYLNTVSYESDGFVQPFSDSPMSGHLTGELAYMNMINNAKKYIYITTPYLILDNEMLTALRLAVECGVKIHIITPHIPDKSYVHSVSRANYLPLLKSGIRIYEYTPGFIHSKTIVCDEELAIVGTTNFDFRSLYLQF
ncbi:MAG: cardiolipin synthase, partial [Oscillospiraceae bacterium]